MQAYFPLFLDISAHFCLGLSLGLLAFYLTATMWYMLLPTMYRFGFPMVTNFYIRASCLLVGLSVSLASHFFWDYLRDWLLGYL